MSIPNTTASLTHEVLLHNLVILDTQVKRPSYFNNLGTLLETEIVLLL
jgi:hypothetical protein